MGCQGGRRPRVKPHAPRTRWQSPGPLATLGLSAAVEIDGKAAMRTGTDSTMVAGRVGRGWALAGFVLAALLGGAAAAAVGGGPVVFRVSDPVHANETILLFGDDIGPGVQATGRLLHRQPVDAPPADGRWPVAPPPAADGAVR